jgi:hypothetical protein
MLRHGADKPNKNAAQPFNSGMEPSEFSDLGPTALNFQDLAEGMYPLFEGDDDDDDGGGRGDDGGGRGDDGGGSGSGSGKGGFGEMGISQSKNNVGAVSKSGQSENSTDRSEIRSTQNNKNTSRVAQEVCEATTNSKMQREKISTQAGVDSERNRTQVSGTCQESRKNEQQTKPTARSSQETSSHSSVAGMQKADNRSSPMLKRKKGNDDTVSESQLKSMKHFDQVTFPLLLFCCCFFFSLVLCMRFFFFYL